MCLQTTLKSAGYIIESITKNSFAVHVKTTSLHDTLAVISILNEVFAAKYIVTSVVTVECLDVSAIVLEFDEELTYREDLARDKTVTVTKLFSAIRIAKRLPNGLDKNCHLRRLATRLRKALIELSKLIKTFTVEWVSIKQTSFFDHLTLQHLIDDILNGRACLVSVTF